MSQDAAAGKLAFGVMVLAFCALTVALRKPRAPEPPAIPPPPAPVVAAQPPQRPIAAPAVAAQERPRRRVVAHLPPPRLHRITARRTDLAARPQYPFNPRERWKSRELP